MLTCICGGIYGEMRGQTAGVSSPGIGAQTVSLTAGCSLVPVSTVSSVCLGCQKANK